MTPGDISRTNSAACRFEESGLIVSGPTSRVVPTQAHNASAFAIAESPGMELRDVVRVLQRRRLLIAGGVVLGVVAAILSILLAQNRYSATATIEVNREGGSSLGLTDLAGAAGTLGDAEGMNLDLLTQQAVVLSDNTALRVIKDLQLDAIAPYAFPIDSDASKVPRQIAEEKSLPLDQAPLRRERALRIFRSGLRVNPLKGTRLLAITYTDTNADRAAAIANAIVDAYTNESTRQRFQASSKTSGWLSSQLSDLKRRVEESQARVVAFQRTSGLAGVAATSPGLQSGDIPSTPSDNVALSRLIELNRDLTGAEVSRIAREAIYTMTQTQDPEVILGIGSGPLAANVDANSPVASGSADLALLRRLREQLAEVTTQTATAGARYGARNPVMIQLATEQNSLQTQIRSELDHIRALAKNDLDLASLDEHGIRRQIALQERTVDEVTDKAGKLLLLEQEAHSSREIYQDLYTKLEEASVTAGIKASNITLVDPARVPAYPSFPKKRPTLVLGCIAGLALGLLAAFTWDYFDDSVVLPEDAERITALPVIGVIPDFRQRSGKALYGGEPRAHLAPNIESEAWLVRSPHSHTAEAYRALRTALLLSRVETAPSKILFVSGSPGEGKSTTCLNAAAAFAAQGDRVLYLDADMRRSKGHTFFDCANDNGLSNCLASGLAFHNALHPHPALPTLFLLPAGPRPPNPSELLGSKRFAELLADLGTHFDYIFIDSPPVLLVTDAQLIAPLVDGCVLVVRAHKTLKRVLDRTLGLLRTAKTSTLGLVMNAFETRTAPYSAYGYRGEGSGYYAETQK